MSLRSKGEKFNLLDLVLRDHLDCIKKDREWSNRRRSMREIRLLIRFVERLQK